MGSISVLFAGWTVLGHLAFFGGLTLARFWTLAWILTGLTAVLVFAGHVSGLRARRALGVVPPRREADWKTALAIVCAVALSLCLHRPDGDDRIYLGQQVKALDNPEASFRSLAQVEDYNAGYVLSSYEFLRAGACWLTGLPVLVSYYFVWPAVIAGMAVAYQSRLLKMLGIGSLGLALVLWFVVMLGWGDAHRTPPNFAFVRMFQGKGALIWVTIPAAQYYWLRFVEFKERASLALLYASIIGGVGFTPTGVPTGVLLSGLFFVATLVRHKFSRKQWKVAMAVALTGVYPIAVGLLMKFYFGHTPQIGQIPPELLTAEAPASPSTVAPPPMPSAAPQPQAAPPTDVSRVDFLLVLGRERRSLIAIGCVFLLPVFLRPSRVKETFSIYVLICSLLLAFPRSSELFGTYAYSSFSWRWLYVLPFVLSVTIAGERIATSWRRPWAWWATAATLAIAFLSGSTRWVISDANHTLLKAPAFKLFVDHVVDLFGYARPAAVDGLWLVSPATGRRL